MRASFLRRIRSPLYWLVMVADVGAFIVVRRQFGFGWAQIVLIAGIVALTLVDRQLIKQDR